MIDDTRDLLGVASQHRHHLRRLSVENDGVLVVAAGYDAIGGGFTRVEAEDARHAG